MRYFSRYFSPICKQLGKSQTPSTKFHNVVTVHWGLNFSAYNWLFLCKTPFILCFIFFLCFIGMGFSSTTLQAQHTVVKPDLRIKTPIPRPNTGELKLRQPNTQPIEAIRAWVRLQDVNKKITFPSVADSYNGSGSKNKIEKLGIGNYKITFPKMGKYFNGIAHATSLRGNHITQVKNWRQVEQDLIVFVNTYAPTGKLQDGLFYLLFYKENKPASPIDNAYTWVNGAALATKHNYWWNGRSKSIRVAQTSEGQYTVTFQGVSNKKPGTANHGKMGTVLLTPYGKTAAQVRLISTALNRAGDVVAKVSTSAYSGAPMNSQFCISYMNTFTLGLGKGIPPSGAFAHANMPTSRVPYIADIQRQNINYSPKEQPFIQIKQLGTGHYLATIPGALFQDNKTSKPIALAHTVGKGNTYATVNRITYKHAQMVANCFTTVEVKCFAYNGKPANSRFNLVLLTDVPAIDPIFFEKKNIFPLPAPKASAKGIVPIEGIRTMGELDAHISSALDQTGYFTKSYFSAKGGYALVTRLERINDDGTSAVENIRWNTDIVSEKGFSIVDYFYSLFNVQKGRFRVIVFVATNVVDVESNNGDSSNALNWNGGERLSSEIKQMPFTKDHACHVLIYEFEKTDLDNTLLFVEGRMQGRTHLEKAQLWNKLAE